MALRAGPKMSGETLGTWIAPTKHPASRQLRTGSESHPYLDFGPAGKMPALPGNCRCGLCNSIMNFSVATLVAVVDFPQRRVLHTAMLSR